MILSIITAVIVGVIGLIFAAVKLGLGDWFKPKSPVQKTEEITDAQKQDAINRPSTPAALDDELRSGKFGGQ